MITALQSRVSLQRFPTYVAVVGVASAIVASIAVTQGANDYVMNIVIFTLFWATAATAWNILGGYVGLMSLGHSLFFGTGAYITAILVTKYHLSWWFATIMASVVVTALGTLILYPTFRLRGPFFSLATFALPTIMTIVAIYEVAWTDGPQGMTWPLETSIATFTFQSRMPYLLPIAVLLLISLGISSQLYGRRIGLYMRATRDDDIAAEAAGVPTRRMRIIAAAVSIAITAVCGSFYVAYIAFLDPSSAFSLDFSLQVVLLSILGGMGTVYGPLIGAALLVPADFALSAMYSGSVHLLLYGVLLMAVVLFLPQGIVGGVAGLLRRMPWMRR